MADETTDQVETQSVEDRIASKFGFPGANQATPDEAEAVPEGESEFADIDWEGATYKIPSKLKDAFMKNQDYTQKTQELSTKRQEIDHFRETFTSRQMETAFTDSIAQESNQMAVIDAYLTQATKVDWATMTTDQMLRHKVEIDNIKEQRDSLRQSIETKRQKFHTDMQNRIKELRGKSREIASKSISGFSEAVESDMRKFAAKEGLSDQEFDNVALDPRSLRVIYKAMQFDKVQSGTQKATESVSKVLKPGAASERMPQTKVNQLNFAKAMKGAKTSAQKANIIEQNLAARFAKG